MVAAIDYSLAPENPFPVGLIDVITIVKWIKANGESIGVDRNRISSGRDSASANLALATALDLHNKVKEMH